LGTGTIALAISRRLAAGCHTCKVWQRAASDTGTACGARSPRWTELARCSSEFHHNRRTPWTTATLFKVWLMAAYSSLLAVLTSLAADCHTLQSVAALLRHSARVYLRSRSLRIHAFSCLSAQPRCFAILLKVWQQGLSILLVDGVTGSFSHCLQPFAPTRVQLCRSAPWRRICLLIVPRNPAPPIYLRDATLPGKIFQSAPAVR
jgi:hypothetical protein